MGCDAGVGVWDQSCHHSHGPPKGVHVPRVVDDERTRAYLFNAYHTSKWRVRKLKFKIYLHLRNING